SSANTAYGYRTAMSDASFNEVYRNINNQWWPSAKLSSARDAFNTSSYYFSTEQIRRIIGLINSDQDRLDLLKLAYDNVTDPTNFYQLSDLLTSQNSRDELNNFVRNNNNGDSYTGY